MAKSGFGIKRNQNLSQLVKLIMIGCQSALAKGLIQTLYVAA